MEAPHTHQECTAQKRRPPSIPSPCSPGMAHGYEGNHGLGLPDPSASERRTEPFHHLSPPEQSLPSLTRPSSHLFHPLLPPHVRQAGVRYSRGHGHLGMERLSTSASPHPSPCSTTEHPQHRLDNSVTLPTSFLSESSVAVLPLGILFPLYKHRHYSSRRPSETQGHAPLSGQVRIQTLDCPP